MWPDDRELPVEVEAAFGADLTADPSTWSWTDLSSRLRAEPIRLRAGGSGGAGKVSPGTCTATLVNDDGALTPLHPLSPYWPNVKLGTPLRVKLRRVEDAFERTLSAGWGSPDSGQGEWSMFGVGGTVTITDATVSGGMGRLWVPTDNGYRAMWLPDVSLRDVEVEVTGDAQTVSASIGGAAVEPVGVMLRMQDIATYYMARAEIDAAEQVSIKLFAPSGAELASASVPSITWTGQPMRVRAAINGTRLAASVWDPAAGDRPAGWQVEATDDELYEPGGIGLRSGIAAGNTNTKPIEFRFDDLEVLVDRFSGFADQWEPTYMPIRAGESASAVRVTASGMLRRLDQGTKPARSAPARYIPTTGPVAYWPLEDGQLASEGAALVGDQPMRPFTGTHPSGAVVTFTQWGRGELAPWLPDAVSRAGNRGLAIIWAPVSMPAAPTIWCVDFMYRSGTDAGNSTVDINPSYLPGGTSPFGGQLTLLPDVQGMDVAMNGEPEVTATAPTLFDGQPHHIRWFVWQDGTKVTWNAYVDGVAYNFGTTAGNMTLPRVTSLGLAAAAQGGADMAQGHVAVWAGGSPNHNASVAAAFGNRGETAAARVARLCAEEDIPVSVLPGESEPLGPQPVAGVMDLLREAEEADMGVLFEQGYGLAYRPRGARYNAPVAMTVDLAQYAVSGRGGDVLSPTYDDQDLRNEWTVGRVNGSSATVSDAAHQVRSGVYSDSVDLNLASDVPLPDHASWRVHLGTVDELREDNFPLDLAANPDLVDGWLSCGVGSRIVRTNPPSQHPGPLDRLVEGWTESIAPRSWQAQVTPSPAASWDVAVADGEQRAAADGSTLAAAMDATPIAPTVDALTTRNATGGWGTSNTGQVWTTTGGSSSDYSVQGD